MRSNFQKKVFNVVKKIPEGKVLSYKKVAELAGLPLSWRAVGNILNKNEDKRIPCHRVVRADRKIGGYNKGERIKTYLLKKEGIIFKNGKITSRFTK
ncbi:MGMT family protein [Patescibacteria group bacterium]|nr:MGMT family protein [Patescibacteria group bacterium]